MTSLIDYLRANYSRRSTYHYMHRIQKYLDHIDSDGLNESQLDILNYLGHLRRQSLHPKTLWNHLHSIKIYYNYLQSSGQRDDHPCRQLHLRDQINRAIEVENLYSMEDMKCLLHKHQAKQRLVQRRDEVMIGLLIYQALTSTELIELQVSDVDLEAGQVRIRKTSSRLMPRILSLKPRQILLLDRYLREDRSLLAKRSSASGDTLLLTKYGRPMTAGTICRQVKGSNKHRPMTPLKIRQSVIHYKLKEGHGVRLVQAFAGHRSILSTEAYQTSQLEELKQGINKYHPLQ